MQTLVYGTCIRNIVQTFFDFHAERPPFQQMPWILHHFLAVQSSLESLQPCFHDCMGSDKDTSVIDIFHYLSIQQNHTLFFDAELLLYIGKQSLTSFSFSKHNQCHTHQHPPLSKNMKRLQININPFHSLQSI